MFKSTKNTGFHMTFNNGLTISVQFGYGMHCEHYDNIDAMMARGIHTSYDAEVCIWDADGKHAQLYNDTIVGYQSTEDVARLIAIVMAAKSIDDVKLG